MFNRAVVIANVIYLLSISCLLGETRTTSAQADPRARVAPADGLRPVTVTVVDSATGEPVTRFSYRFGYRAPAASRPLDRTWRATQSRLGAVVIEAPRACRLTVDVQWKNARAGTDDYHEFVIRSNDNARRVVVKLERGLTVHGTVRDAQTREPIAGVTLTPLGIGYQPAAPGEEREATSDKDGRYELHGVDPVVGVWGSHPGYSNARDMNVKAPEESRFDLFLRKIAANPTLRGTVRDSNGKPLEGVRVSNGKEHVQTARDGTYALLGPSFGVVEFGKEGYVTREFVGRSELRKNGLVTLETQVPMLGRVLGPDERPVENFEVLVGPGKSHEDRLSVPSIKRAFKDPAGQFALGLDHQGSTWIGVRAQGYAFDEDGRFSVDGVFAGLVKVGFPYMVFDVQHADEWTVQVVEGQTTEVVLLDPASRRTLPVEFRIGDDSLAQYRSGTGLGAQRKVENVTTSSATSPGDPNEQRMPMFRIDLIPRSGAPLSFADTDWEELDMNRRVVISDVSPGAYQLRVIDWLGSSAFEEGVLFEQDITMPSNALPIKISLGGGCITGRLPNAGGFLKEAAVIAVPQDGRGSVRRTRCDSHGNFCVRYLDPGNYTILGHDPKNGWCRVENIAVASNATDVGERRLAPGGTIQGVISFKLPSPIPDALVATGPSNVSLTFPFNSYSSVDPFELTGLWPGTWTIAVRTGRDVLATASAELSGTEKVPVEIAVGNDRRP